MTQPPKDWTVVSMLTWATDFFEQKEVKSPRLSIEWLLAYVLDIKRLDLYLNYDRPLSSEELDQLRPLVKRRADHEPLQYLTGKTDFYKAVIQVNESVLIPRQETEQLVELILNEYSDEEALKVIDLGTGSGCIPIALKMERPNWEVHGCDISDEALTVARSNAELNETEIHFLRHDFSTFLPASVLQEFDLIISNPPYIPTQERSTLDAEVREYEPELALFCESTETMFDSLQKFCRKHLKKDGKAFFEIHENQGNESLQIFLDASWHARLHQDLSKKDRFLITHP